MAQQQQQTKIAPPEWDLILSAAQKNQYGRIREMIEKYGVDPNHSNAVGQTALHIASLWGHVESVETLVELGANVNVQNNLTGATPLHMVAQSHKASMNARCKVVHILLNGGADKQRADHYGAIPMDAVLMSSDDQGMERLTEMLQPKVPDVHVAIQQLDCPTLKGVLEQDTSQANIEFQGMSPVGALVDELLKIINSWGNGESEGKAKSVLDMMIALLDSGADINVISQPPQSGITQIDIGPKEPPLHKLVCCIRDIYKSNDSVASLPMTIVFVQDVVDIMMKAGVLVLSDTIQLLHQAARRNELPFVKFLIERLRIDPNTKGRQGMTPLQFAARSGHVDTVLYLLEQPGIDLNSKDDQGMTALYAAKVNNKEEIVRILEENG